MIGAIVRNDIVENLIVLKEEQIEELSKALNCDIIDARPYGLIAGDLRTGKGWTRNAGGEQIILPLLESESYDSYTKVAKENVELGEIITTLEEEVNVAGLNGANAAAEEVLAILSGEVEE